MRPRCLVGGDGWPVMEAVTERDLTALGWWCWEKKRGISVLGSVSSASFGISNVSVNYAKKSILGSVV